MAGLWVPCLTQGLPLPRHAGLSPAAPGSRTLCTPCIPSSAGPTDHQLRWLFPGERCPHRPPETWLLPYSSVITRVPGLRAGCVPRRQAVSPRHTGGVVFTTAYGHLAPVFPMWFDERGHVIFGG